MCNAYKDLIEIIWFYLSFIYAFFASVTSNISLDSNILADILGIPIVSPDIWLLPMSII